MICADVQSLARAAPEPASTSKVSFGDAGNSFDQFLQAVTSDQSTGSNSSARTRTSDRETVKDEWQPENEKPVDNKSVDNRSAETKSADQKVMNENRDARKLAEENKTEEMLADQEIGQAEAIDESIQTAIAAAIAAQIVTAATAPVQQTEAITETSAAVETTVPQAVIPVMQNQPSTVIQLPETEPQPLPDELKQAVQQPKVEVKDFQTLVDTALRILKISCNIRCQNGIYVAALQVAEPTDAKPLNTRESAIKVVDLNVQSEDMAELDMTRATSNVYALASTKTEKLSNQRFFLSFKRSLLKLLSWRREQGQSMRIQIIQKPGEN